MCDAIRLWPEKLFTKNDFFISNNIKLYQTLLHFTISKIDRFFRACIFFNFTIVILISQLFNQKKRMCYDFEAMVLLQYGPAQHAGRFVRTFGFP